MDRPHSRSERLRLTALVLLWILCCGYVWSNLDRGWVPHDEGTLGHAAERVAVGELPHVDFADVYTGGLAMANAVAFRFREDLLAPRILLFLVFVLWVPVFYWIARQFASWPTASAATMVSVALGLPLYPAALPSWYNLYFATFGLAAVLAWLDSGKQRWLLLAGLAGGLSVIVKITGLYYLGAAAISIAILAPSPATSKPGRTFPFLVSVGALTVGLIVMRLVGPRFGVVGGAYLIVPIAVLLTAVAAGEWLPSISGSIARLKSSLGSLGLLGLGAAIPIGAFLLPYITSGSVQQLVHGVFILPAERFEYATLQPPTLRSLIFVPPLALTLLLGQLIGETRQRAVLWLVLPILAILLLISGSSVGYFFSWTPLYYLVPLVCIIGGIALLLGLTRQPREANTSALSGRRLHEKGATVLLTAAMVALVQVPFAHPLYAMYAAPLGVLGLLSVLALIDRVRSPALLTTLGYLIVFLVLQVHSGSIADLGKQPGRRPNLEPLDLDHGGILVEADEKYEYEAVVRLLQAHAGGRSILAGPDSPELYFLSGLPNSTRTLFDFLQADVGGDQEEQLLELIEQAGVRAVAINSTPSFSAPFSAALLNELAQRFPSSDSVGRFTVRWSP